MPDAQADVADQDVAPSDPTPADPTPADPTPAAPIPADSAPADSASADSASVDSARPGSVPADSAPADKFKAESRVDEAKPGEPQVREPKAKEIKAEEPKAEESKVAEPEAEELKAAEPKPRPKPSPKAKPAPKPVPAVKKASEPAAEAEAKPAAHAEAKPAAVAAGPDVAKTEANVAEGAEPEVSTPAELKVTARAEPEVATSAEPEVIARVEPEGTMPSEPEGTKAEEPKAKGPEAEEAKTGKTKAEEIRAEELRAKAEAEVAPAEKTAEVKAAESESDEPVTAAEPETVAEPVTAPESGTAAELGTVAESGTAGEPGVGGEPGTVEVKAEGAGAREAEKAVSEGSAGVPEWPPPSAPSAGNTVTTQRRPATLDDLAPLPKVVPSAAAAPTMASPERGKAGRGKSARKEPVKAAARSVAQPAVPAEPPAALGYLATALSRLRAAIGGTTYPLAVPSAEEARKVGASLVSQLDDYLLPRLARLDAPLLVVVGGSTGAGKSTLVNSLVRAPVSTAGVLRPTTRSPVLVSHPNDSSWFRKGELLPGLTRTVESSADPHTLQLVSAPALGPGLAFLDAPDIDSVVDRNRQLAAQLLAAADLWLFVTTAARYADAVPWELLKTARLRGTVIALVLDRAPADAAVEVSTHLAEMLTEHHMGAAPLFVLPETTLDGQGLLSEDVTRQLHDWFAQLAADSGARAAVVRQTLDGALGALGPAVEGLAVAADEQSVIAKALDERVNAAFRTGRRNIEDGLRDGRLLRGEVLARWQEFVGTGEFFKSLESKVGHLRDRLVSAFTGRPAPGRNLQNALESQMITLVRGVVSDATEQAYASWQAYPAGVDLLEPALQKPATDLPQRAERMVRDWQHWVLDLVRKEAGDKRIVARGAAYAVNGVGLAVMITVFTATAFIPTGAEVAVGAGTTVAAQKVLEAVFGDQMIRSLAARARAELLTRVNVLLDAEAARFTDRTAAVGLEIEPGATLRQAAAEVERARKELALTGTAS
ncbi:hypothetical protein [Winogradskya consettensis]